MSDAKQQLDRMIADVRKGRMTRREFVGRTTALGVSAALAWAHVYQVRPRRRNRRRAA